jgi:hypothetical protein
MKHLLAIFFLVPLVAFGQTTTPAMLGANQTFTGNNSFTVGVAVGSGAIVSQAGNFTFSTTDNGKVIVSSASANATATVPTGLPIGFSAMVIQSGNGTVTFTANGTTLQSFGNATRTGGLHSSASILSTGNNTLTLSGALQ